MVGLDTAGGAITASTEARKQQQLTLHRAQQPPCGSPEPSEKPSHFKINLQLFKFISHATCKPRVPVQAVDDVRAKGVVVTEDEGCGTSLLAMPGATQDGTR